MRIATFNINGIKARGEVLSRWLAEECATVDVVLLQEIKSIEPETFLAPICAPLGYHVLAKGQKGYNGVAILSKKTMTLRLDRLPSYGIDGSDDEARYIEATIDDDIVVGCVYLPNGNPKERKLDFKLSFMKRLNLRMQELLSNEDCWMIGGDYNVCPCPRLDTHDARVYEDDAICADESIGEFRRMLHQGVIDVWRSRHPDEQDFTYWDYTGGSWQKNQGVRIDHFLASPRLADRITACKIDKTPRNWERPSDHTPIYCDIT